MTRLIDADKLAENFAVPSYEAFSTSYILSCIKEAPTVDAVEVVRCKDCIHYNKDLALGSFYCEYLTDKVGYCDDALYMQDDDFCIYGEREGD